MASSGSAMNLDVRKVVSRHRLAVLLSAFDALEIGQPLLLVGADEPGTLLRALQVQRKGLFDWATLVDDVKSWHVAITRREGDATGAGRRLTEALSWEHDRLTALEQAAHATLAQLDCGAARRLYRSYQQALNRHIRLEEELIFPVFEVRAGLPYGGPTAVMRAEHREIRMALEELLRSVDDPAGLEEVRERLRTMQLEHERKEESILYPGIDRLLTARESDTLVAQVQAFPC